MKKLAELAGVDVSTVSRALRGDSTRVAASTIERVQRLARETGFVADSAAASLRSGRSRMLGVVIQSLDDIVMGLLVTAIDEASASLGYLSTTVATHDDVEARARAVDRLLSRRVDGFILCDSAIGHEMPERLRSSQVPCVFAMRGAEGAVSITADDRLGGQLVAEHFIEAGHKCVSVVPGPAHARTAVDRVAGFEQTIRAAKGIELLAPVTAGGFGVEDGYAATAALLETGARPTALFCANDHTAIGAARALTDRGLVVGVDVALVGYNDIPAAAYLETPLSSVKTDVRRMGHIAAQQLVGILEGTPGEAETLVPQLIVRASSDQQRFRASRS